MHPRIACMTPSPSAFDVPAEKLVPSGVYCQRRVECGRVHCSVTMSRPHVDVSGYGPVCSIDRPSHYTYVLISLRDGGSKCV